jgi:hypothetical protein
MALLRLFGSQFFASFFHGFIVVGRIPANALVPDVIAVRHAGLFDSGGFVHRVHAEGVEVFLGKGDIALNRVVLFLFYIIVAIVALQRQV